MYSLHAIRKVTPPEDGPEDPGENPEDPGTTPDDPDHAVVPAGTYTDFVDPLTGEGLAPDTLLGGLSMLGMYMGCYYMCPVLTEEASLQSGSVTVAVDGDIYTITGTLYDGHENEVSFKYEGEVEKMIYEEYAVKSLSGKRGMLSKKPSFVKVR